MTCRCGHARGRHARASGKKRLPCQAVDSVPREVGGVVTGGRRLVKCLCRDYVPPTDRRHPDYRAQAAR